MEETMVAWEKAAPEAAGLAADLPAQLDRAMAEGWLGGMHAVAVCRGGALIAERYRDGPDETIGDTLGVVHMTPRTLHDLRSVTKSMVSVLYGIALHRGLVPPLDATVVDSFPEYPDLRADPARRRITVAHALSMAMGLEWDENLPYSDPRNSEIAMENAPDRFRFVLDRPIVEAPGRHWIYSGGATALIGEIIARGTKMDLADFAKEALFTPLGIGEFDWWRGRDGRPAAASGLRLRTPDLLRIGAVLLDGGTHEGREVIPEPWLTESFRASLESWPGVGYGHFWYHNSAEVPALGRKLPVIFASGYGGQRLYLMPELDLAVVTFSGDYGKPEFWKGTERAWQIVLGGVTRQ
jgi:CubicO group peptidase (beta-lactamase class C family)